MPVVGSSTFADAFVLPCCAVVAGDSCIEVELSVSIASFADLTAEVVEKMDREERVTILSQSMDGGVVSTVGS